MAPKGLARRRAGSGGFQGAAWACYLGVALICVSSVYLLWSLSISSVDEAIGVVSDRASATQFFALRTVTVTNKFPHEISVYYEDGMSGSFLQNIKSADSAKIQVSTGHVIYATEPTGWTRIATISIRPFPADVYLLAPSAADTKLAKKLQYGVHRAKTELNAENRTRPHPLVRALTEPKTTAMAAKFRSMCPDPIDMWYDDGGRGTEQGHLRLGQETTTNTYAGHVFYFTLKGKGGASGKGRELARFTMSPDQVLYIIYDAAKSAPADLLAATKREETFMKEYFAKTGIHWRHYYGPNGPRPPPVLHMWEAPKVGAVHVVESPVGYWKCEGTVDDCQGQKLVKLELEVVSLEPRVFIIPQFLSDFEAEHIIKAARPRMASSSVGDIDSGVFSSNTRTSKNAWVPRKLTAITNSLFQRAADLLNIDEEMLNRERNAEDMQVVHYINGQKYDSHHDWGVSGHPHSRLITLLIYLTDQASPTAGGETSFPKGGADERGFKVKPVRGTAVLFYNLLKDGNGDDKALHAALPCMEGEKYLANFWVRLVGR